MVQGPQWLDGSPYTYRRWLPPDPSLIKLNIHHRGKAKRNGKVIMAGGQYFPGNLQQFLYSSMANTTANNCTIAVSFNPFQMYWVAIPCDTPFSRYALICQQTIPNTDNETVVVPNGQNRLTCSNAFILVESSCVQFVTVSPVNQSDLVELKCKSPSLLLTLRDDSSMETALVPLLHMWSNNREFIFSFRGDSEMCVALTYNGLTLDYNNWYRKYIPCRDLWKSDGMLCSMESVVTQPCSEKGLFSCDDGSCVLQTRVCDGYLDCPQRGDERHCSPACYQGSKAFSPEFCLHDCPVETCVCTQDYYHCESGGCLAFSKMCDGDKHCPDGDDENGCPHLHSFSICLSLETNNTQSNLVHHHCSFWKYIYSNITCDSKPYDVKERGSRKLELCIDPNTTPCNPFSDHCYPRHKTCLLDLTPNGDLSYCPTGDHLALCTDMQCWDSYKCPQSYCLSWRLVCDGIEHCPRGEDEHGCEGFICQGLLRCGHGVCVHPNQMSDGVFDCPDKQDESLCGEKCPFQCHCQKNSMTCSSKFIERPIILWNIIKNIHLHNTSAAILTFLRFPKYLLNLIMFQCNVITKETVLLKSSEHLKFINLSGNSIEFIETSVFKRLSHLQVLDLSFNRVTALSESVFKFSSSLRYLSLKGNQLEVLSTCLFGPRNHAFQELDFESNAIRYITKAFFCNVRQIRVFKVNNNPLQAVSVPDIIIIRSLNVDQQRFCCHLAANQICYVSVIKTNFCFEEKKQKAIVPLLACVTPLNILLNGVSITWWVWKKKLSGYSISVISLLLSGVLLSLHHMVLLYLSNSLQNSSTFQLVGHSIHIQTVCSIVASFGLIFHQMTLSSLTVMVIERVLLTKYALESKAKGKTRALWRMTSILLLMWTINVTLGFWLGFNHFRFDEYSLLHLCMPYLPSLYTTSGSVIIALLLIGVNMILALICCISLVISSNAIIKTKELSTVKKYCPPLQLCILSNLTVAVLICVMTITDLSAMAKPGADKFVYTLLVFDVLNAVINTLGSTLLTSGFLQRTKNERRGE